MGERELHFEIRYFEAAAGRKSLSAHGWVGYPLVQRSRDDTFNGGTKTKDKKT